MLKVSKTTIREILRLEKEVNEVRHDLALWGREPSGIEHKVSLLVDDLRLVKTKVGIR